MARTMKKFSAGGAQGRYERRMADIEKDYKKAAARKTGKDAEVAEAKRQQRIADAKDDLAKRTGADRTATRAAERLAESNLTKTRKYGAPKAVTTEAPEAKVTDSLPALTATKSGISTTASKPMAKKVVDKPKVAAKPVRTGDQGFSYKSKTTDGRPAMASIRENAAELIKARKARENFRNVRGGSNSGADNKSSATTGQAAPAKTVPATGGTALRGKPGGTPLIRFGRDAANDPARKAKLADMKRAAEAPGASGFAKSRYKTALETDMYAKGGSVKKENTMKYAKGGSTPPQPTPAERARSKKQLDSLKKEKVTPEQAAAIGRGNRSGMAKGGKATKFGKALVKKSSDTMGRAMVKKACGGSMKKYASGGLVAGHKSADGCATKGKTKGKMV